MLENQSMNRKQTHIILNKIFCKPSVSFIRFLISISSIFDLNSSIVMSESFSFKKSLTFASKRFPWLECTLLEVKFKSLTQTLTNFDMFHNISQGYKFEAS